jgi:acetylglutamate synthase
MCIRPKKCIILNKIIGRNNMYKRIISEHKKIGKFVIKDTNELSRCGNRYPDITGSLHRDSAWVQTWAFSRWRTYRVS